LSEQGLRIAFLGTAEFAVPTLHLLARGPHQVAAVFTRPDRPAGRGRRLRASPVKLVAEKLDLPLFQPERVSSGEGLEALRKASPDLLFVAAFGEILTAEALSVPRLGAVNLHASLLPRYRGAAPIQRALIARERETGVTVQWMVTELDAGDIVLQRREAIGEEEDFGGLHDRLAVVGAEAAAEALALVAAGSAPRIPQADGEATYAPPIRREELVMDWGRPAAVLAGLVRALSPRPGARTTRRGQLLKVLAAADEKKPGAGGGTPGGVMELTSEGFWVSAGDGWLLVVRVQPAGRNVMTAADYLKGYRLQLGEVLGA
jgi:methionyl-tRNA formyltransferase